MDTYLFFQEPAKNNSIVNIIMATLYLWFYDYIYHNYIVDFYFEHYTAMDEDMTMWYYLSGIIPILFFRGLSNVASIFSIYVYIFAYIPFNETLSVGGYQEEFNDYRMVFFIAMCLFFITDNIRLKDSIFEQQPVIPYIAFELVSFIVMIVILALNAGNMHLTNFLTSKEDLYDLRADLKVVGGTPVIYIIYWLKNIVLPLILVCSAITKRYISLILAFAGCICIYTIDQQKITFVAPFVILALYGVYRINKDIINHYYHLFIMGAMLVVPALSYVLKNYSDVFYQIAAIVIMRTQCIEGMELATYFKWFGHSEIHPYTHYSHVGFINMLTDSYPYDAPLGRIVTNHGANANGMFWLMDGIAADGVTGCIIISVIFILFKSLFNGISNRCEIGLFAIFSVFAMSMTMNVSLFTAIISCGLLLVFILFIYVDFPMLKDEVDE